MIVDTNALSAIVDGQPEVFPLMKQATILALPVIVLGEYRFGIAQVRQRAAYEQRLASFLPSYRIVAITEETSQYYADLRLELKHIGKPIPSNDLWIAALCRQHGLPLLSRDRHFDVVPDIRRVTW